MDIVKWNRIKGVNDDNIDTEMLMIFDQCCDEMRQIMEDSYGRYKLTQQYHNIVSNIFFVK